MKATFFIVSASIGASGHMSEKGLMRLDPSVVEIGSHTVNHRALANLPNSVLHRELKDSRLSLEFVLGRDVRAFAFPYGSFDAAALRALPEAGYELAFTSERGRNESAVDPFRLERYSIYRGMSMKTFENLLLGSN